MPGVTSIEGENASCEVNSFPGRLSSPHPKWNASEFQCSICYELLLNPVVGSCGHDFCKHCIEEWKVSRQLVGQAVLCPICRAVLLPSTDQSFGVCIRLRETIEKLFPEQIAARHRLVDLTTQRRKCSGGCGTAAFPFSHSSPSSSASGNSTSGTSSTTSTTNSSDTASATATTSSGSPSASMEGPSSGGAPGPPTAATPYPLLDLDLDLLSRAAEQYRELSLLVSAITSVPAPPAAVVQAFTHAAATMADHVISRQPNGATAAATPLQPQRVAELARLFLSSGPALTATAATTAAAAAATMEQQQQPHLLQQQSYAQHYSQLLQQQQQQEQHAFAFDSAAAAAAVATMSGPEAAASAAMAAQLAAAAAAARDGGGSSSTTAAAAGAARNGGFLEAALTLLTSAAATSTAAGQLRTLVSALHHQQQAAAAEGGAAASEVAAMTAVSDAAGDALRTTANTVQQLTAEAAAASHLLRMHHRQQLQSHMRTAWQAQAQVQAQVQAQAQAQQLLQLQATQQQAAQAHYLGRYIIAAAAPLPPPLQQQSLSQQPQVLITWENGLTATAAAAPAPVLIVGGSQMPPQPTPVVYPIATVAGGQQPHAGTVSYQPVPYISVPVAATTTSAIGAVPSAELYGWGQAAGSSTHQGGLAGPTWPSSTGAVASTIAPGQSQMCYPLAAHVRLLGTQPYMTAASAGSGGLQPMRAESGAELLPELAAPISAVATPQHGLRQRQQQQQTQAFARSAPDVAFTPIAAQGGGGVTGGGAATTLLPLAGGGPLSGL